MYQSDRTLVALDLNLLLVARVGNDQKQDFDKHLSRQLVDEVSLRSCGCYVINDVVQRLVIFSEPIERHEEAKENLGKGSETTPDHNVWFLGRW